MAKKKYDDLSQEELVRLLEARDRRDATRFGLVWEANEIERDKHSTTVLWPLTSTRRSPVLPPCPGQKVLLTLRVRQSSRGA